MGLDPVGYQTCQLLAARGGLGSVLTLGRQWMSLSATYSERQGIPAELLSEFCEPVLTRHLGATSCDSIDVSDYEGATFQHDLNLPLPANLTERWDSVVDLGTLEHVFDVKTSFDNVGLACKEGGLVAHVLPANQQCGHGLFQFSPEFLFTYYSQENGYSDVEVFVVLVNSPDTWYPLARPTGSQRLNLRSLSDLYVVTVARKMPGSSGASVQQSDYVNRWAAAPAEVPAIATENQIRAGSGVISRILSSSDLLRSARRTSRNYSTAVRAAVHPVSSDSGRLPSVKFESLLA